MRRLLSLAVVVALDPAALAEDHHREHLMPPLESGFVLSLRPGEQVSIDCSFHAEWEECLQVYDQKTGQLLVVWNNNDGGGGSWLSPKNETDQPKILLLVGRHKKGLPNGRLPWLLSKVALLDQTDATRLVGWDDSHDDRDYNDALAFVKWVK